MAFVLASVMVVTYLVRPFDKLRTTPVRIFGGKQMGSGALI
jgi:hypothetical protein